MESQCGWCKDRWGLSWQITPRALTDALAAGGGEAKRAFEAVMTMKKVDIAAIEAPRRNCREHPDTSWSLQRDACSRRCCPPAHPPAILSSFSARPAQPP